MISRNPIVYHFGSVSSLFWWFLLILQEAWSQKPESRQVLRIDDSDWPVGGVHHDEVVDGVLLEDSQDFCGEVISGDANGIAGHQVPYPLFH
jgi:hypothetical protein